MKIMQMDLEQGLCGYGYIEMKKGIDLKMVLKVTCFMFVQVQNL